MIHLTYYLDVMSSWCFYSEPNLRRLLDLYGKHIEYDWRISLVTEAGPEGFTREQMDWFYRRSGSISGVHLNSDWCQDRASTLQPNTAAQAARKLGFTDDRARLALSRAGLIEGKPVRQRDVCLSVLSQTCGIDPHKLAGAMDQRAVVKQIEMSGREFNALKIDQRPAYVLHSDIGDRAVFSGIWSYEPLEATVKSMIRDEEKYAEFAGSNPPLPSA
ncbi:MAG: hypothetical protein DLM53_09605 [Candidatus Eremiobacter antarcticus]|nr:DsbA family protein [Candidatus Eremiobacteraeota bacterium]MBC5807472.1 DsbA family protein [Candidatus Eremiobacteraeota bacterium]PZR61468.1 MAG: hypothetical protein DLM53_09605 [Candidatus Eremiobacter sp. RRmetagenome_bin22]